MKKYCFKFAVAVWLLTAALSLSGAAEASYTAGGGTVVGGVSGQNANGIAIGSSPTAADKAASAGAESVAIGFDSHADPIHSVAIGSACAAKAEESVALGTWCYATAEKAVAIGAESNAWAERAVAAGYAAYAKGADSSAYGAGASASESGSSAFGTEASASVASGVALGANSKADRTTTTSGIYRSTGATSAAQTAVTNTVKGSLGIASIGSDTATRQLAGVAAGINDTDAVNVAQLKALASVTGDKSYASANYITANDDLTKAAGKLDEAIGKITADGNYVKASSSTNTMAANVQALDTQIGARVSGNYISTANAVTANMKALDTQIGKVAQDGNYITSAGTVAANLQAIDTQIGAIVSGEYIKTDNAVTANLKALDTQIGKVAQDGNYITLTGTVAANLQAIDTQIGAKVAGDYIKTDNAVTVNLKALDTQIGKVAQDGNYITSAGTVAANLGLLDTAVVAVSGDVTELKKAVGDNSDYSSENVIKKTNSVIANLSALDAAQGNQQYAEVTEKGPAVNGDSTTAAIGKLNNSVGDVNAYQSTNLVAQGDSAVTAIGKLDNAIGKVGQDGNYITSVGTVAANLQAIDTQIGKVAQDGNYITSVDSGTCGAAGAAQGKRKITFRALKTKKRSGGGGPASSRRKR